MISRPRISLVMMLSLAAIGILLLIGLYGFAESRRAAVLEELFPEMIERGSDAGVPASTIAPAGATDTISFAPPFRFAVAPIVAPEMSLVMYHDLARYLGRRLGRDGRLVLFDNYAAVNAAIRRGECDLAFICTYAYVTGARDGYLELAVGPVIHGETTYHSWIIVPAASEARSLADLRGRRFASADLLSTSGWLYPASRLIEMGEDPTRFFGEHLVTRSHDRSIVAVADGHADGAAVDHLVFLQMPESVRSRLRVIEKSPAFGIPPFVFPLSLPAADRARVRDLLLEMDRHPEGRAVLREIGIDRFETIRPELYDPIRKSALAWEARRPS
jgi:phosphonate transport system substrate-binding protein